ncbi:MAG: Clp protease N-terminal domain-containing protein [Tepidiformaceae bacterium]
MPDTLDFRDPEWVAEQLNIDKNAVYRYLNEGTLPGMQLGRKWLISESTLAEYLKAEERRQTIERRLAAGPSSMERYSPRALRAIGTAQDEALRRKHNWLGTEHLLLALMADPENSAVGVLAKLGVEPGQAIEAADAVIAKYQPGESAPAARGAFGLTPRAKKAIDLAAEEATRLNHSIVGCDHLLLGLIAQGDGIAAAVLKGLGVTLEPAREQVASLAA